MISGDVVDADQALAIGLIDTLTEKGAALDAARTKARSIGALAPLSIATVKAALASQPSAFDAALDLELSNQVRLATSADYLEGRAAFVEKRRANFRGV